MTQTNKLNEIKVEGLKLSSASIIDGEPSFESSKLNILNFLDSP